MVLINNKPKRSYSKHKQKAVPFGQLNEKLQHQALKLICREMKIVKRLIQLRITKKIHEIELKPTQESMSEAAVRFPCALKNYEEVLNVLKKSNHIEIGQQIAKREVSIVKNQNPNLDIDNESVDKAIYDFFKNHRRTKDLLFGIESMIKQAIDKNNSLRAEEQRESSKKRKLNDQMTKRSVGTVSFNPLSTWLMF